MTDLHQTPRMVPDLSSTPDTVCTKTMGESISADETALATAIESTHQVTTINQESTVQTHRGKLILDATAAPQAIRYLTDLNLLNEARERTEQIIDGLCSHLEQKKPRTYRQVTRYAYLTVVKLKALCRLDQRDLLCYQPPGPVADFFGPSKNHLFRVNVELF